MEHTKFIARCLLPLELPGEELNYLAKAIIQAMEQRLAELTGNVDGARQHVEKFERKYTMNYLEFKSLYLQDPTGKEEDFVTWGFWEKLIAKWGMLIDQYEELLTTYTN